MARTTATFGLLSTAPLLLCAISWLTLRSVPSFHNQNVLYCHVCLHIQGTFFGAAEYTDMNYNIEKYRNIDISRVEI